MMNRTALASKAQALLNASQGLGGGLSEEVQDACRTYAQRRARMVTELRAAQGPFTGTASVQAQGSLECMEEGRVGVLVFCSATRPGGGWLTGATAQEESISRASTWALSCAHPEFHTDRSTNNYFYKDAILAVDGMVFERNNTPPGQTSTSALRWDVRPECTRHAGARYAAAGNEHASAHR